MRPPPTKPKSSKTNQDKPSNWGKPRRRSDEPPRDPYVNIVEPPVPPPAAPKKPSLQTYASQPSTPPSHKMPGRPEPPGQDPYIIEPPSPLPRAQTFTGDQVRPLPRAPTFQAKDRAGRRPRREYISSKSDSDSDTPVYTSHRTHKPSRSHVSSPIKIQPTFGQQAMPSRSEEQTPIESPEGTKFSPEDWAKTFKPYAFTPPPPPRRAPEPTVYRVAAGRPRLRRSSTKPLSYEEKLAAAASYYEEIDEPTIPLTQENLEKHTQTPHGRPSTPTNGPPSDVSYASAKAGFSTVSRLPPQRLSMSPVPSQRAPSKRTKDSPIFYADESGYIDAWPAHLARTAYVEVEDIVRPSSRRDKPRPAYA
jgi:hypothetical protein